MKRLMKWLLVLAALVFVLPASAAELSNKEAGYFENTRKVLLLDAACGSRGGSYAARLANKEMGRIFRYPYYRTLDASKYSGRALSAEALREAAVSADADIAAEPVIVRFEQYRRTPPIFFDRDPIVTTTAQIRILYWEEGMEQAEVIETRYFDTEIEGPDTDAAYIFDKMWARLMKKFPYRRVPTDRSRNLSGEVTAPEDPDASGMEKTL